MKNHKYNHLYLITFILCLYTCGCDLQIQSVGETRIEPAAKVTNGGWPKSSPAWSPDGSRLAFATKQLGTNFISVDSHGGTKKILYPLTETVYGKCAFSPDHNAIAYQSYLNGHIWILFLNSGTKRLITPDQETAKNPSWSPDGRYIAYDVYDRETSDNQIWIVSWRGNDARQLTSKEISNRCYHPCWSPDGKEIAFSANYNYYYQITTIPVAGGESKQITFSQFNHSLPSWSHYQSQIAFMYSKGMGKKSIGIVSLEDSVETRFGVLNFNAANYPAWAPDRPWLAFWADGAIWVFSTEEPSLFKLFNLPGVASPMWDERWVFAGERVRHDVISTVDLNTMEISPLTVWNGNVGATNPTWLDNENVAFLKDETMWKVPYPNGEISQITHDSTSIHNPETSPDGSYIIYDNGGDVFIKPTDEGHAINLTENIDVSLTQPTLSPDGDKIACIAVDGLKIFQLKANELAETAFVPGNFSNPSWSMEDPVFGSHIAVESGGSIYVVSLEKLKPELVMPGGYNPSWSPNDGTQLAYIFGGEIYIRQIFKPIN